MKISSIGQLVVMTGAGVSAESGVPTFRGPEGIWNDHRPEDLATEQAFERDPKLVWQFYAWRRDLVAKCRPNIAHRLLADLELRIDEFLLLTQNVDGLHQAAGSRRMLELHGSLWSMRCTRCRRRWEDRQTPMLRDIPICPACSGLARPDVVLFDENLEPSIMEEAVTAAKSAATMLVIGTSALVLPAANLPLLAKRAGARLIEINPSPTPLSDHCDEILRGPASDMLKLWINQFEP